MKTRHLAAILSIASVGFLSTATRADETYRFTVALDSVQTIGAITVPQANPALGTLREVRIRTYFRLSSQLGVENLYPTPGAGRASFNASLLVSRFSGGVTDFLNTTTMSTKGREKVMSAFDSVIDFGGTSGSLDAFTGSMGSASIISEPGRLAGFIGTGNVRLDVAFWEFWAWRWYSGARPEPALVGLTSTANAAIVITYIYGAP